jgi:hypothetical protein
MSPLIVFTVGYQGPTGASNVQSFWIFTNGTYSGVDFAPDNNHVVWDFGDHNDNGYLGHKEITTPDFDNGSPFHHCLTATMSGTGGPPSPVGVITWYINGADTGGSWTEPFGQTEFGNDSNFANPLYVGCVAKSGGALTDYSNYDIEGLGIWTRALTAAEVAAMYKQRGRWHPRGGLVSYYPFFVDGKNLGPNGVAATPEKSTLAPSLPTTLSTKIGSGYRRRVM